VNGQNEVTLVKSRSNFEPVFTQISANEKKYTELHGDIVSGGFIISSQLKKAILNPDLSHLIR